jgi:hypothetical protein
MSEINYFKVFELNNKYDDIMYQYRTDVLKRKEQRLDISR